jgi:hypothetical protein
MLQQLAGGQQRDGRSGCNSSASSELTGSCSSDDGEEEDSSVSGLTAPATESACGSAVLYNGNGNAAGEGSSTASGLCYSAPRGAAAHAKPQPPLVMEALECALSSAHEWQFDAFALADASQGHPLSTLGYYLFHKSGLIEHFGLKAGALARFLRRVEEGYRQNPYHNATHAADVLQTYNAIIHRCDLCFVFECWSAGAVCVSLYRLAVGGESSRLSVAVHAAHLCVLWLVGHPFRRMWECCAAAVAEHCMVCMLLLLADAWRCEAAASCARLLPSCSTCLMNLLLLLLLLLLLRGGLMPGYVDPLHLMACYTAAVMHDFEHGGLTNDFLVNSLDSLAVLYNDRRCAAWQWIDCCGNEAV